VPSRPFTPAETAENIQTVLDFVTRIRAGARVTYGAEFDQWPEESRIAAVMAHAMQALLSPEAYSASRLNLDFAAYTMGLALGTRSAEIPDPQQLLQQIVRGFGVGRAEHINAVINMPTQGNA